MNDEHDWKTRRPTSRLARWRRLAWIGGLVGHSADAAPTPVRSGEAGSLPFSSSGSASSGA